MNRICNRTAFRLVTAITSLVLVALFTAPLAAFELSGAASQVTSESADFGIAQSSSNLTRPHIAYGAARDVYLVVWEVEGPYGGSSISMRTVSAGNQSLGPIRSVTDVSGAAYRPDVAYNPVSQEFLVVWHDYVDSGPSDILGQRISSDGTTVGSAFAICDDPMSQQSPTIVCEASSGDYYVAWTDLRAWSIECFDPAYAAQHQCSDISGVTVDQSGRVLGSSESVCQALGNQSRVSAALSAAGQGSFLLAWTSYIEGNELGHIVVRSLDEDGSPIGEPKTLLGGADKDAPALARARNADTNMIVWHDDRSQEGRDVMAAQVLPGPSFGHQTQVAGKAEEQQEPAIASDGLNGFLVVWQDNSIAGDEPNPKPSDILARCVGLDGAPGQEYAVYAGSGDQSQPAVAFGRASESYFIAWQDNRDGSYAIRGAIIQACESPTQPLELVWVPLIVE